MGLRNPESVAVRNRVGFIDDDNPFAVKRMNSLVPESYDYIIVTSTDANNNPTTIVYKSGGSSGTTVATLTLTYDAEGCFESVEKA